MFASIPPVSRERADASRSQRDRPQHNAGNQAGRKPACAEDIARAPEFVGWMLTSSDLGDDTLDHRVGEGPGRCRLPPIGYATVSLRTKKIKGLHENDFIVAVKLDRLAGKIAIAVADKQIEP
jgi:hypothetical protein